MSGITDANSLRGARFRELIGQPKTWIYILGCSALMAIAGAFIGPVTAVAFAALTFLAGTGITFWIADRRAARAFYAAYAETRGLTKWTRKSLGGVTPLLRKGDKQRVTVLFEGELAPGLEGQLALWSFVVEYTDGRGNRNETDYPFTLVLFSLPETLRHLRDLRVQRKAGFKAMEGLEDAFRRSHERVTLESETMRDRYEIFRGKDEDEVWVRRIFSPSFIVWLTESAPDDFAFELENGWLCAYVPKHRDSVAGLDGMISIGTAVATRLREEVAQS